ncbi:MAG: glycerol-3-phosphate 1-O-acyltransferase PlsY [Deltaproteobacteria bacterium]|jgi:acyl phosphate:glycerol-3-phosphate acyltransferase|nr:glycerol-3-phosphate 1-O-acyltransferase PlsY [Deltaproteobacteria bacterium]
MLFLFIIISYLIGSIPTGLLLAKAVGGGDIRKAGSGNIGATNVTRLLGKKLGMITLLGDVLKAAIPMLAVYWYFAHTGLAISVQEVDLAVSLCGGAAFLGHIFPVYLKFKGGKGVATALGVFIILEPVAVLISLFLFTGIVYVSGFVSVGSLLVSALMTLWIWLLGGSPNHVFLAFFIAVFIWLKHMDNINRLLAGTEKSWKNKKDQ